MKFHQYRSWPNYMSRAKREHILAGFEWTDLLDLVAKSCSRSLARGLGPARQSAEYSVREVWELRLGDEPLCEDGPVNPKALAVLGAYFLTREIELSLALVGNFQVLPGPRVVWRLPATKTDPAAASVTREWGCLCQESSSYPCPAHCAAEHLSVLTRRFGVDGGLPPELPVFPTVSGKTCEKHNVVRSFEELGRLCGLPLVDPLGRRAFGGHSARVSGARWLANMGLELFKLAVLARWSSNAILRYVADAPLSRITTDCRKLLTGSDVENVLSELWQEVREGKRRLDDLDQNVRNALESVEQSQPTVRTTCDQKWRTVQNCTSGVWHAILVDGLQLEVRAWRTVCGWKFGGASVTRAEELPPDVGARQVCDRCFPGEKRSRRQSVTSSSDSS